MVGTKRGKLVQICSSYPPELASQLKRLTDATRVPTPVYLREALEDLLKKYASIVRPPTSKSKRTE